MSSTHTLVQTLWPCLRWPVYVSYLWWGLTWLLVARYYIGASSRQWNAMNPQRPPSSGVLVWVHGVLMVSLASAVRLAQGKFRQPYTDAEHTHPVAVTLQHGIVCSALCSAVWGITLFTADRSDYSVPRMLMNMFCVALSSVGALIHLYPPMRVHHIVLWRSMMLFTWAGIPLGYALSALAYGLS